MAEHNNIRHISDLPAPRIIVPDESRLVSVARENFASEFHKQLVKWINDFNLALDDEHEVGIRLVNFGQTIVFTLDDIGYSNPSLIFIKGKTKDGNPVELVQHVSQISILLMKLPRKDSRQPKKRIGFPQPDTDGDSVSQ